jgi:hypothetical protein
MGRARLSCLLALLLSSAVFDDAWAAVAPRGGEDQAAENDEYLRSASQPLPTHSRKSDRPAPGTQAVTPRTGPDPPAPAPAGVARSAVRGGPPLLYLFMSLRR